MNRTWSFRPKLAPTLGVMLLLPLLVELGLWQWHKAQIKLAMQQHRDALATARPVYVGTRMEPVEGLLYRRVVVRGRYERDHQFLLDNQVHGEQAGFNVLTPLRIEGGNVRVLVDRGWVPMGPTRDRLPQADPPQGEVEITGTAWQAVPPKFVLPGAAQAGWPGPWQRIDLDRYRSLVPFPVQAFVVRLAPDELGSYVCDWPQPAEKIGMHRGYALQWFGMAGMLAVFYLAACFRRETAEE